MVHLTVNKLNYKNDVGKKPIPAIPSWPTSFVNSGRAVVASSGLLLTEFYSTISSSGPVQPEVSGVGVTYV